MNSQEREQLKVANDLQEILGERYRVYYDDGESCLTRIYYIARNGLYILVKEVPNSSLHKGINIWDFMLSQEQSYELNAKNLL